VYVYGASTRGLVIMQAADLHGSLIRGAAERNPEKWGRLYSGTGIACVPEDDARRDADSVLVLPWHFLGEFLERERAFLERGRSMIVPLPQPRVITKSEAGFHAEPLLHGRVPHPHSTPLQRPIPMGTG
jgi:hypothetical protein